jgi:hypothetical protein
MERELVVAEVRLRRAGRDDEAVVGDLPPPVEQPAGDGAPVEVDARHLRQNDVRVALVAQDVTQGRRDVSFREDPGRDLVEQRLEEMMRLAVDQGDVGGRAAKRLHGGEAGEAASDHHDAVSSGRTHPLRPPRAPADAAAPGCRAPSSESAAP